MAPTRSGHQTELSAITIPVPDRDDNTVNDVHDRQDVMSTTENDKALGADFSETL